MQQLNKTEIDFVCPFCKKEITEETDEETMMGNPNNIDQLDFEKTDFVIFHTKCYKEKKEKC